MRTLKYLIVFVIAVIAIGLFDSCFAEGSSFHTLLNTLSVVVGFCLMLSYLEGRKS